MAPSAWGFDINNAVDFPGVLPEVPDWQAEVERLLFQESYDNAAAETEKHLAAAKGSNDGLGEALTLLMLARVRSTQNSYEEAKGFAQQALEKFRSLGNAKGAASALLTLAKMAVDTRERQEAEKLCEEAIEKFQAASSKVGEAAVHHLLARMRIRDDEVEESLEEADKAQTLFEKAGDKEGQAAVLIVKGNVFAWNFRDAQDDASKCGKEAAAMLRKLSRPACRHREGDALFLAAAAAYQLQRFKDGLKAAKDSVEIFKECGGPRAQASSMRAVTMGLMQTGALDNASEMAAQTVEMLTTSCKDPSLLAEAKVVDALVARQRVVKGIADEEAVMLQKAREVLDLYTTMDDEPATAVHRLELAQALQLTGDSSAALTEAKMALEFFQAKDIKEAQGMCMIIIAQCQHNIGETETALKAASKAADMFADPIMVDQASELVDFLKNQSGRSTGQKWTSNTSWGSYEVTKTVPPPSNPNEPGVKRSMYSDLIKTRIYTGDTPEGICFEWQGIMYMDQFLGQNIPFIRDAPPFPGMGGDASAGGGAAAPAPPPPPSSVAKKPASKSTSGPSLERSRPAPEKPSGPVIIKPAVVGNDILGGRYRDCPEDVHDRMVTLARAGCIPMTTLSQRSALERKKPTFHGNPEWREAARWGYIHPTITAPRSCKWQKVTVGWKLMGPAPGELLMAS